MAASEPKPDAYVCTLSEELVKRAEEELNEKPQWRSRDIQALRDMIKKKSELRIRTDDAFLLRFLRAKKFDYDRAMALIVRHYEMRVDKQNTALFSNLRPSAVKHVLEAGVTGVLPHRDKLGRQVIVFRPGRWDPSRFPLDDIFKTNFLTLSKLIQDEETQINGVVMVIDLKNMGWTQAKNISPFYAKRISGLLQDAFPMRMKGIHYLNEPKIFDIVFSIMKPFLKEKILQRLHFHGDKFDKLAEHIDPEYLPEEYGGKQPPFSNEAWATLLLACDKEFDEEAKYGMVVSTGQTKGQSKDNAMDCLAGSYRKLEV